MIIELAGLPCTGKSSFRRAAREYGFENITVESRVELAARNVVFLCKHPFFFVKTLLLILKHSRNGRFFYYKFMNVLLHHNARYEKAQGRKRAVIDEGHTQNIYSIFENKLTLQDITRYLRTIPHTDLIIIFNEKESVIFERSRKRGYLGRKGLLSADEQKQWIAVLLKNNKTLIEALSLSNRPSRVIPGDYRSIENTLKDITGARG